jgi:Tol biopolymer transport system component
LSSGCTDAGQQHRAGRSGDDQRAEISRGKIAFMRQSDIYMMNSDGTGQTNLTSTRTIIEDEPTWSPDGKQIAFTRGDVGDVYVDQDIYVMNADGTGRTRLANNASSPSFTLRDRE